MELPETPRSQKSHLKLHYTGDNGRQQSSKSKNVSSYNLIRHDILLTHQKVKTSKKTFKKH